MSHNHLPASSQAETVNQEVTDEKLRVLALSHSSNLAGAQLALASLIENTQQDVDWTVVSPMEGPLTEKLEPLAHLEIARYPWWCKGQNHTPKPVSTSDIMQLDNTLNNIDYDLALTNTMTVPWLAHNARARNLPHLWYVHEYGNIGLNLVFPYGFDESMRHIDTSSDIVMTVSEPVGNHLLQHGVSADKLRYINQSFDVASYLNIASPETQKNLLTIGSIKKSKGQLDALQAFAASDIKNTHSLTIAGPVTEPHYAEQIANYIQEHGLNNVNFIPNHVDSVDMVRNASEVLVCSTYEALGRVTLEAMAAGRVVIGNDSGGTSELLSGSKGVLYDGTVQDLTTKLNNLASETATLIPEKERRAFVENTYSPSKEHDDFMSAAREAILRSQSSSPVHHDIGRAGIIAALQTYNIVA